MNQLVESPVTLVADSVVGDRIGVFTTTSEPTMCAALATVAFATVIATIEIGADAAATAFAAVGVATAVGAATEGPGGAVIGPDPGRGTGLDPAPPGGQV